MGGSIRTLVRIRENGREISYLNVRVKEPLEEAAIRMAFYWPHRPTTWTILPSHLLGLKKESGHHFYNFQRNIISKQLLWESPVVAWQDGWHCPPQTHRLHPQEPSGGDWQSPEWKLLPHQPQHIPVCDWLWSSLWEEITIEFVCNVAPDLHLITDVCVFINGLDRLALDQGGVPARHRFDSEEQLLQ